MINTDALQKVLEMVHLTDLTGDGQRLVVRRTGLVVVLQSILDVVEYAREQQIATNDESSAALASFAMDSHNRLFKEVILNELELFVREGLTLEMAR